MELDNLNKRTLVAAFVYFLSVAAMFVYILTYGIWQEYQSRQFYALDCLVCIFYSVGVLLKGFENKLQTAFIILTLSSLSVFFIFILLYYQFGLQDYKSKIGVFLLIELITVGCVVISGLKQGLFNHAKDML